MGGCLRRPNSLTNHNQYPILILATSYFIGSFFGQSHVAPFLDRFEE